MRRSPDRIERAHPAARVAFTFIALFALALQAFVVQTHLHAAPPATQYQAGGDRTPDVGASQVTRELHQGACAMCLAYASSGRALVSHAAALTAPPMLATIAAAPALPTPPRALTHSWQSRAPPIAL